MDIKNSKSNLTDKQLVAGCLDADTAVQEIFVRQFSNLVYAAILGVVKAKSVVLSQCDIEDLHSTVFLQLFEKRCRKLGQFQGKNGCSLASWVRMISVRTVLDHLRRRKDVLAHQDRLISMDAIYDLQSHTSSQWDRLAQTEQAQLMEKGLQQLSDRDQLMIRMHCLEGCSLKQMAEVLKVSPGNVHSVKHRAVQRLKHAVERVADQHKKR
jgi:RNA polymerase sigma factor (sigma-70 family)